MQLTCLKTITIIQICIMLCFGEKPRSFHCKVIFLDETELIQEIQNSTIGQDLLEVAFKHLNLVETAYFGLRYVDSNSQTHWLDTAKKIAKQLKGTDPYTLYFGVKFYVSDPCKLLEEITRYQFFLQVKQDVLQGRLPVAFDLCAELCAYVVQSELGDYDHRRHQPNYISDFQFVTNQTNELESRTVELHKSLVGQVPAVAELNYLEKVKWLDMYGVDLHPVLGEDNVEYFIGLTPSGVIVLRNKTKVGNYFWPRISKVYFKGKYFMLRVRDKNNEDSTYGFELPSKQACKHLWKCCVEHHAFFRLTQVNSQNPGKVFTLNSRFRYSGRTERQIQEELEQSSCNRSPPQVTRVPSRRYQRRLGQPDGIDSSIKDMENKENERFETRSNISLSRSVQLPASNMSRASSVPVIRQRSAGSPQSDRSAPWEYPRNGRGLFSSSTNPSPRSVRSAGYKPHVSHNNRYSNRRSSSVDSEDSCGSRRRRHHRSRQGSDNDSELSRSSKCSHSHSRRHRSGSGRHREDSGDRDSHSGRHRHRTRRQKSNSNYELVDSESQWKEVQMAQREKRIQTAQNAVVRDLSRRSGYVNSGMESESEASFHQSRKNRRHKSRSRSQSPSESRNKPPEELRKHFQYNLIDTSGLSSEQLQNISYTKVETDAKPYKVKCSPGSKHRSRGSHSRSVSHEQKHHGTRSNDGEYGPPPPYTPNPQASMNGKINHTSSPASSTRSIMHHQALNGHLVPSLSRTQQSSMQAKVLAQTQSQNMYTRRMMENGNGYSHENSDSGLGTEVQDYSPNSHSLSRIATNQRLGPKPAYFASMPSQNHTATPKPVSMSHVRTLPMAASYSSCSPSPSSSPSPRMPSAAVPIPGGYGNNNSGQAHPQTACNGNMKPRANVSPSSYNVYNGTMDRVKGLDLRRQPSPATNLRNGIGSGGHFANGLGSDVVTCTAPRVHPSQTNSNLQSGLLPFANGVAPSAYPYPNQGQQLPARTPVQLTSPHMSAYHHAAMVQNFHWVANGNPGGKAVPVYTGTNGVPNNTEQHTRSENHEMSTEL